MNFPEFVLLSSISQDFGVAPGQDAQAEAQKIAKEFGEAVSIRDVITDELLATIEA